MQKKKKNGRKKKAKAITIDNDVEKEQATSTINNKDMNDRQNIVWEDFDVQNQATINMLEDEKKNDQSKVKIHKIKTDSPPMFDQF
jgi:hypothetical protein